MKETVMQACPATGAPDLYCRDDRERGGGGGDTVNGGDDVM